jgi:hypothetical protein
MAQDTPRKKVEGDAKKAEQVTAFDILNAMKSGKIGTWRRKT